MFQKITPLALFALLALPVAAPAQNPGDCVAMGNLAIFCHNLFVYNVDPASSRFTTLFPPNCGFHRNGGATPAPLNDGVLFPTMPQTLGTLQLYRCRRGSTGIMTTLPGQFAYIPDMLVDQCGDLIILAHTTPASASGLYRFSATGSLMNTLATGLDNAVAAEEDPATGDFLVAMPRGDVLRVTRGGQVTTAAAGALPAGAVSHDGNLQTEFATGQMLVTWGKHLFRLDPTSGRVSTLLTATMDFLGLAHDPVHGGYYRTDIITLVRFDPATSTTVKILSLGSHHMLGDVATWGGRMLTGTARPAPGTAYPVTLAMEGEAGKAYLAAASFGTLPGIMTPAGRIHLVPDALFYLSLQAPALFQGFAGVLDPNGTALLGVGIPAIPALRGLRFYLAAVSYDTGGLRRISDPLGVTIE